MTEQLSFDDLLLPPGDDRIGKHQRPGDAAETQIESAAEIKPATGRDRIRVLYTILAAGDDGATDQEIQLALSMDPSTERPRRVELVEKGWVYKTEARRPTLAGRKAVVWRITPAAWQVLRRHEGSARS